MKRIVALLASGAILAGCQTAPTGNRAPVIESLPPPAEQTQQPSVIEPSTVPTPAPQSNAAVIALLEQARQQKDQLQFVQAAASLERAIRISPRDPVPYLELARIRYHQGNLPQAQQLCNKAVTLARDGDGVALACRLLLQ